MGRSSIKKQKINKSIPLSINISWVFAGNFIYAVSRGCILIFLARFGTIQMVGEFGLAFAITAPIFMLLDFKLRQILGTDIQDQYHFSYYLGLRLLTSLSAIVVIAMIIVICGYKGEVALIILIVGIAKGFESISDVIFGLFQKLEITANIGKSLCAKGIFSALSMGLLFQVTGSLVAGIIGLAATWFLLLILYDFMNARKYTSIFPSFKVRFIFPLVRISLPLGAVTGLATLNANTPGYFIQGYLGSVSLGYYTSIIYLIAAGETVINSLGQSLSPKLVRYYASGNKNAFLKLTFVLTTLVVGIGAIGLTCIAGFGSKVLVLLYSAKYANYFDVFILLMISSCIGYISIIINYALTAARIFKIQPFLFAVVLIINVAFSFILIPQKGLEGVIYATIISSFIQLLSNLVIIGKLFVADLKKVTIKP